MRKIIKINREKELKPFVKTHFAFIRKSRRIKLMVKQMWIHISIHFSFHANKKLLNIISFIKAI